MQLIRPGPEHLTGYCAALAQGWSPNTTRPDAAEGDSDSGGFCGVISLR